MSKALHQQIAAYARALIADSGRWVQHRVAVTKDGREVEPESKHSHGFCAVGSLYRAAHEIAQHSAKATRILAERIHREFGSLPGLPNHEYESLSKPNDNEDLAPHGRIRRSTRVGFRDAVSPGYMTVMQGHWHRWATL